MKDHLVQPPCRSRNSEVRSHRKGFECLRRTLHSPPGQPVPVLCDPHREKVLSHIKRNLLCSTLHPLPFVLSWVSLRRAWLHLLTLVLYIFINMNKVTPPSPLLQAAICLVWVLGGPCPTWQGTAQRAPCCPPRCFSPGVRKARAQPWPVFLSKQPLLLRSGCAEERLRLFRAPELGIFSGMTTLTPSRKIG